MWSCKEGKKGKEMRLKEIHTSTVESRAGPRHHVRTPGCSLWLRFRVGLGDLETCLLIGMVHLGVWLIPDKKKPRCLV